MQTSAAQLTRLFNTLFGLKVHAVQLLGSGMCNRAWLLTTTNGEQFLVKTAQENPETPEQNNLLTEARLLQELNRKNKSFPIPLVAFVARQPMLYGYPFLQGEQMKKEWPKLSEPSRRQVCADIAQFHACLHHAFTEAECRALGLCIDKDANLDAENEEDLAKVLADEHLPLSLKAFAATCAAALKTTYPATIHAFCHNDSHHENILLHRGRLAGVVDFGDADYGDIHREFGRYALDYPAYFEAIVQHYEAVTGRRLSRTRIIARSFLEALDDIADDYRSTQSLSTLQTFEELWKQY